VKNSVSEGVNEKKKVRKWHYTIKIICEELVKIKEGMENNSKA